MPGMTQIEMDHSIKEENEQEKQIKICKKCIPIKYEDIVEN